MLHHVKDEHSCHPSTFLDWEATDIPQCVGSSFQLLTTFNCQAAISRAQGLIGSFEEGTSKASTQHPPQAFVDWTFYSYSFTILWGFPLRNTCLQWPLIPSQGVTGVQGHREVIYQSGRQRLPKKNMSTCMGPVKHKLGLREYFTRVPFYFTKKGRFCPGAPNLLSEDVWDPKTNYQRLRRCLELQGRVKQIDLQLVVLVLLSLADVSSFHTICKSRQFSGQLPMNTQAPRLHTLRYLHCRGLSKLQAVKRVPRCCLVVHTTPTGQ